MLVRGICLMLAVAGSLVLAAQSKGREPSVFDRFPVPPASKNLLFYGNSFTYYSWGYGVPELVQLIAIEAGHPSPTIRSALVDSSWKI